MKTLLSHRTPVTLALTISLIVAAVWISSVQSQGKENADAWAQVASQQDEYNEHIQKIDERLSHIEGMLEEREHHR